jgi:hypothetical protein
MIFDICISLEISQASHPACTTGLSHFPTVNLGGLGACKVKDFLSVVLQKIHVASTKADKSCI